MLTHTILSIYSTINSGAFLAIISVILLFSLYLISSKEISLPGKPRVVNSTVNQVLWQRFNGVFFLGIIPMAIVMYYFDSPLAAMGLNFDERYFTLGYTAGIGILLIFLSRNNALKQKEKSLYPQIKVPRWTPLLIGVNFISWGLYLFAYEFLFRGFLLFLLVSHFPIWLSILINTILYSLAHVHKNKQEILGSIPFGIVLCLITLQTGNFITAFLLHLILATSSDAFALIYSKTTKVKSTD
ncbi:MAG: CPBP family intramembrane glutamic endopeptidase [Cyclobacteriaceae bacterium]